MADRWGENRGEWDRERRSSRGEEPRDRNAKGGGGRKEGR
jgi:hypothetical protein